MKAEELKSNVYTCPEGELVKTDTDWMTVYGLLFVAFIAVTILFGYIWGFDINRIEGDGLGEMEKFQAMTPGFFVVGGLCLVTGILIQYVLLYLFSGRDYRELHFNWSSFRVLVKKELPLKYYRLALLLYVVAGGLLLVHGFGAGDGMTYLLGVNLIIYGVRDFDYFRLLRAFKAEDRIVDGRKPYSAIVFRNIH